jgi:hypothetical protein
MSRMLVEVGYHDLSEKSHAFQVKRWDNCMDGRILIQRASSSDKPSAMLQTSKA